ncbi:ABC transporter ATP-binding protein [Alkalicoccobacillus porphyridii]|nr:ABC transporter ATP-binding protein [Alkalicoccobacillus porphyridii]
MIQLNQINLTYPSSEQPILNDLSIQISKGEWVSLVGPSGSGKTSLLKILSGTVEPTQGDIVINQTNINEMPLKKRHDFLRKQVATVYQQFRLLPQFSVLENVMLPLVPYTKQKKQLEQRALALITEVGLDHRVHHFPEQLSGGEQQRVAIARALLSDPPILLCDEPTGNLDSKNRDVILELLSKIHSTGKTILLATHDEVVAQKGDTIHTFHDGVVHTGAPST